MAFKPPLQAGRLLGVHFTASSVFLGSDPILPLSLIQMTPTSCKSLLMRVSQRFYVRLTHLIITIFFQ